MTFKITNIRVEEARLVAFYEFENGEVNSNAFPMTASVADMRAWGEARAEWFVQREAEIELMKKQVAEEAF